MTMRRRAQIPQWRQIPAPHPDALPAGGDAGIREIKPAVALILTGRLAILRHRRRISQPVLDQGRVVGGLHPAHPLLRDLIFTLPERCHERVIGISVVPGLAPSLRDDKKIRRTLQPFIDFRANCTAALFQSQITLPTEFKRKKMVIESLLTIATVGRKLLQYFLFPHCLDLTERSRPPFQLRPARQGTYQPGQFAQQMIVCGGTKTLVAPDEPDMRGQNHPSQFAQRSIHFLTDITQDRLGCCGTGQRVNPTVIDQAQSPFQRAGPVITGQQRILFCPVIHPADGRFHRPAVIQDVCLLCQTCQMRPAVDLPDHFDISTVRQFTMVQVCGAFYRLQIHIGQIILLPKRMVIYFQSDLLKNRPRTRQDAIGIKAQRVLEFVRCLLRWRQMRKGIRLRLQADRVQSKIRHRPPIFPAAELLTQTLLAFRLVHRLPAIYVPL